MHVSDRFQIVIVDDHPGSLELLATALRRSDVEIHCESDPRAGIDLVKRIHPQLVITDLMMPGLNGIEVLSEIMRFDPTIDVVLMTGHYTTETAVEAIRKGAADYLEKPVNIATVRLRVGELISSWRHEAERAAGSTSALNYEFCGMLARSPVMWDLFDKIQRVAPHYRTLLIQGATGSGKDLVARALHEKSGVKGRFVVLNCSAITEQLFESEMFGHVRGSFTGADRDKVGLFEFADGGTLFLDEVGDMPLATQAKLLRVIQNQEVLPVGSLTAKRVQVRVVAATHRDLEQAVARGGFREDLFYRLSMVELDVPPLARRRADIPLLARRFVQTFSREYRKAIVGLTPRALMVLEQYDWPGNVRELDHVIGRACMLANGSQIEVCDLPGRVVQWKRSDAEPRETRPQSLEDQERQSIQKALVDTKGNQSEAARLLGIGRDALRYKMKKFQMLE